jgi:signal transduction histidine kinase
MTVLGYALVSFVLIAAAAVVTVLVRQARASRKELERRLDELAQTRDRLVREEKLAAVGRLASGIAHEIRNPVAMILSAVSMGRSGSGLSRDELDGIIAQEARRLDRLTSDFLLYARQRPLERRPVRLAEVLGSLAGVIQPRLAEARLALSVDAPPHLAATVDPFQIQQALLNLLLNAADATPAGGALVLGAEDDGAGGAVLFLESSGPAIPAEAVAQIFEPFFTTKPSGSGLGLPITRSIAQAHGGDVALALNEPGHVRFALTLPGALCPPPADAPAATRVGAHPDR